MRAVNPVKKRIIEHTVLNHYIGYNIVNIYQDYYYHLNTHEVHKYLMGDHGINLEIGHTSARKLVITLNLTEA